MEPSTSRGEHIASDVISDLTDGISNILRIDNASQGPFPDAVIVKFCLDTNDPEIKEICQISARCNGNEFNQYIIPMNNITPILAEIHRLKIRQIGVERKLFHNGIEVDALSPREGLTNFLNFLEEQGGQVLLAAHSCTGSQGYVIIREMRKYGLFDTFQRLVLGFINTIDVFQAILPNRKNKKNKLQALAREILGADNIPKGHHARVNVEILESLITNLRDCTDQVMKRRAKNLDEYILLMPEDVKAREVGLAVLNQQSGVPAISVTMIKKIARAGITIDMLRNAYRADGGVGALLRGHKVTKTGKIIQSIIDRLALIDN